MQRYIYLLLLLAISGFAGAQVHKEANLVPQKISGGRMFNRNISFADYQTRQLHRNIGSFFSSRAIIPANLLKVKGVPLYHKEKRRSKDYFRFDLSYQNQHVAHIEVQAIMLQNETFHLFSKQDSSFFGKANTDLLSGSVQPGADTTTWWELTVWNLNASKDEPQRGVIKQGDKAVTFEKTTMLLRENGQVNSVDTLFSALYMVYQFRYNGEVIAAVACRENDRICWIKQNLEQPIEMVVAAVTGILRLRRTIYK